MPGQRWIRGVAFAVLGALVGFALIVAPVLSRVHTTNLFSIAESAIKHLSFLALWLLFGAGLVWGLLLKRFESLITSLCQPAMLPMVAIAQMVHDPTSHNLWPLEFMIYAFMGGVGVAGAAVGLFVKRVITKQPSL